MGKRDGEGNARQDRAGQDGVVRVWSGVPCLPSLRAFLPYVESSFVCKCCGKVWTNDPGGRTHVTHTHGHMHTQKAE